MKRLNKKDVAQRLKEAMRRRGMSTRAVQDAIRTTRGNIDGSSYGTIAAYWRGDVQRPRVEVLEAIAEALGYRPEWLIWGEGAMTDGAQRLTAATEGRVPDPDEEPFEHATTRISHALPSFELLSIDCRFVVLAALERFMAAVPPEWIGEDGRMEAGAYDLFLCSIRQTIEGPLLMWGDVGSVEWHSPAVQNYIRAALSAFLQAIPDRIESVSHAYVDPMQQTESGVGGVTRVTFTGPQGPRLA